MGRGGGASQVIPPQRGERRESLSRAERPGGGRDTQSLGYFQCGTLKF